MRSSEVLAEVPFLLFDLISSFLTILLLRKKNVKQNLLMTLVSWYNDPDFARSTESFMNIHTIRSAFYKSIPVLAGYVVLGIGFGILLRNAGYGVLWAASMSLFIYAGSLQYVGAGSS